MNDDNAPHHAGLTTAKYKRQAVLQKMQGTLSNSFHLTTSSLQTTNQNLMPCRNTQQLSVYLASLPKPLQTAKLTLSQQDATTQLANKLFAAKAEKKLSFEALAKELGRSEVAVAAIFYGQARASDEDVDKLAAILGLPVEELHASLTAWPNRGKAVEMPPCEPLIYRLYEVVQNYGYAYKTVINEKFGDGIMSAIAFSTYVDKEVDDDGVTWVNIRMRGKWLPFTRF